MRNEPDAPLGTVLYLSYGRDDIIDQTIFSILSILRWERALLPYRIVVYTDQPDRFRGLPVDITPLDQEKLDLWLEGSDYIHRRKTCAIEEALSIYGGKLLFLDSDTYLKGPLRQLFSRIAPGRACFHLREGYLKSTGTVFDAELRAQLLRTPHLLSDGEHVVIDDRTLMWNTGIVGVDVADRFLVQKARKLSDEIWRLARPDGPYGKKIHHGEQFAMGYAFRGCRLSEGSDLVYHYWLPSAKSAFAAELSDLTGSPEGDLSLQALEKVYASRYRETGFAARRDVVKMFLRLLALDLGIGVRGVRRSVL